MSQLNNGVELLGGMGGTTANNLFDANMQRLDTLGREHSFFLFIGQAQAGDVFGKQTFPYDVLIEQVEFNCYAGAPASGNLVVEVDGPGTAVTATLTPSDGNYKLVTTGSTDWVTAGTAITLKFTSVDAAVKFPLIILQVYKRKL